MRIREIKKKLFSHNVIAKLEMWKYIGPGLLVTVGFIDPGNWAANIAAGSEYGYSLLWVVLLSTIMLILFQHNSAHLGIVSGLCLAEAIKKFFSKKISIFILLTSVISSILTAMAELLGAAIALNMLFGLDIAIGGLISLIFVLCMIFYNSYNKIEKWIIGFVSLIGLSFIVELFLTGVGWGEVIRHTFVPRIPYGSMVIVMSVLGAVIMPHNIFLHSEIIQTKQWNIKDEATISRQLKYEFVDTLLSMIIGFAINSAIVIVAAEVFYKNNFVVSDLKEAHRSLSPIAGEFSSIIFALALLFAGLASSVTAGLSGGIITAGFFKEPYDIRDNHSRWGVLLTIIFAFLLILIIRNPYKSIILSQMFLSIQLPFTIIPLIYLTSSKDVMGKFKNTLFNKIILYLMGSIIIFLNLFLLFSVV